MSIGYFDSYSIHELSKRIKALEISPIDLVEHYLKRIKELNPILNSFITLIDSEKIYENAQKAERDIKSGFYKGNLHGIPFSVKDILFAGNNIRCTSGSKVLSNFVPKKQSAVVKKLIEHGAILVGTNNLNEFASGITGLNPFYGNTLNPHNTDRISGGSSGGSAAAVASGMIPFSIGTDTGGSIRVPASLCGVVGLKPTYGSIRTQNIFPLAPSLDHVGWITNSVWDSAALLDCLANKDFKNKNEYAGSFTEIIEDSKIEKFIIGIPKNYFFDTIDNQVDKIFDAFIDSLKSKKSKEYEIKEIELSDINDHYQFWKNIRLSEASEIHLKLMNFNICDYSNDVRKLLLEGSKITAVEYIHAKKKSYKIKNCLSKIFRKTDAIIIPTTIITAPKFGELENIEINDEYRVETRMALLRNTILFNLTGNPAINVPIGLSDEKMPIGAQIVGNMFNEKVILSIGFDIEKSIKKS